jgi:DNA-binding CsgD family transcriptional regulator
MDHVARDVPALEERVEPDVERALEQLWGCIRSGDFIRAAGRAVRLQESTDDPDTLARVEGALGLILQRMGRAAEARDRFEQAASWAVGNSHRSAYLADASMSRLLGGDLAGADRVAREAQRMADAHHNWPALCEATNTLAAVSQSRGDPHTALALARQAVTLGESASTMTGGSPMPHLYLGLALIDLDRFDESDAAFTTGLERVRREQNTAQVAWYLGFRCLERFLCGRWDDASLDAAETLAAAESSGTVVTRPMAAGLWAAVEAFRGNESSARALIERTGVPRLGAFGGFGEESVMLAYGALAGEPAAHLDAVLEAWYLRRSRPYLVGWRSIAPVLVRSALDAGDRLLAEAVTREAVEGSRLAGDVPSATTSGLRCEGLLAADPEMLDAAIAHAAESSRPFVLGHTCLDAGKAWLGAGETARGVGLLRDAWDQFQTLRATVWMTRTGQLVARHASVPSPRSPLEMTGWSNLTAAERAVARLAATGITTPAMAANLSVSSRTVQSHLAHIYTKLGIHSRVELAARMSPLSEYSPVTPHP